MSAPGAGLATVPAGAPVARGPGVLRRAFARPEAWVGSGLLLLVVGWGLLGPLLLPAGATEPDATAFGLPPGPGHWFGTTDIGEDLFALTALGLRTSLGVGLVAAPLATALAALVGSVSGYVGGRTDRLLVGLVDLALVLPSFYLLVLVSPLLGRASWFGAAVAIAAFGWMVTARALRGASRSLRERDFVRASVYSGARTGWVVRRHVLPHLASLLVVDLVVGVGAAVLTEATLGWVGLGVTGEAVSLGTLLADGSPAALTRPWLFWCPAAVLVVAVLGTGLVGDAVRDALDPAGEGDRRG